MITVKFNKKDLDNFPKAIITHLEERQREVIHELAEKMVDRISIFSDGEMKVEKVVDEEKGTISLKAYGPAAVKLEQLKHPFEYTANMLPKIIKSLKW